MFRRNKGPESFGTTTSTATEVDPWLTPATTSVDTWDDWGSNPERSDSAHWGEQNTGAVAASAVLDGPSKFLSHANWGPDGRVVSGARMVQGAVDTLHGFANSGIVHAAEKIPVAGKYLKTAEKIVNAAHAVSQSADSFGGFSGIAEGFSGVVRDPRAAMEVTRDTGGKVLWEGLNGAFDSLAEQVTVEKRDGRRRFGIGKIAGVAANLLKTGGASGIDILVDAGTAGFQASKESAMSYAHQMPRQFAGISSNENGWTGSPSAAESPFEDPTGGW